MKNKYKELLEEKDHYKTWYEYYEENYNKYYDKYFETQEKLRFVYLYLVLVIVFFFALSLSIYRVSIQKWYNQWYCEAQWWEMLNEKCIYKDSILELKK